MTTKRVVIVGGGFAGMACVNLLIHQPEIHITLIDKNNFHQFTPLLYQVATSALASENVATPFRIYFKNNPAIDIKMAHALSVDPTTLNVETEEGLKYQGDVLVLAAGATVNYFSVPGAKENSFPLYTLSDAELLRSRIIAVFEAADCNPELIKEGFLNFVIVGAGPTGTELAGALADLMAYAFPKEFLDLAVNHACIYLVDHSPALLKAFSIESQKYATEVLTDRGVRMKLGLSVQEVAKDHVVLSNGEKIFSRTIIWAGGEKAAHIAENSRLPVGEGGRINVDSDLTVKGYPNIYALGDIANIPGINGKFLPQLASVAQQSGYWAAKNIIAEITGKVRKPFIYEDKGIMAMIGRNAAITEIGKERRELKGTLAFAVWLGVHAALLSTFRQKVSALTAWTWNYFSKAPALQILDREDAISMDR